MFCQVSQTFFCEKHLLAWILKYCLRMPNQENNVYHAGKMWGDRETYEIYLLLPDEIVRKHFCFLGGKFCSRKSVSCGEPTEKH